MIKMKIGNEERHPEVELNYNEEETFCSTKPKSTNPIVNSSASMVSRYSDLVAGRGEHSGGGLRQTLHGTLYQLRLCIKYLLYALELPTNFEFGLASEHKAVDKYDDVVYKVHNKLIGDHTYHFVQAKHVQNPEIKEIKAADLLKSSNNNWGDRLTLTKYFKSYRQIIRIPGVNSSKRVFIICTNAGLDVVSLKKHNLIAREVKDHDFMKVVGGKNGICYRIEISVTNDIFKKFKELDNQPQSKTTPINNISDNDVKTFLNELIIAVKFPNEIELGNMIKEQIQDRFNIIDSNLMADGLQNKMIDWLNKRTGEWLNREDGNRFLEDIKPKEDLLRVIGIHTQHIKGMSESEVFISDNNFVLTLREFLGNYDHLLQVITNAKLNYLTQLKIYQAIQIVTKADRCKITDSEDYSAIFVDYSSLGNDSVSNAFLSENAFNLLVVSCTSKDTDLSSVCETCINKQNKKIIMIVEQQLDLDKLYIPHPKLKIKKVRDDGIKYTQLSQESQKLLINKNNVIIQESSNKKSITSMFNNNNTDQALYKIKNIIGKILDPETLTILVKGEGNLKIGKNTRDSNVISDIYIERHLKTELKMEENINKAVSNLNTDIVNSKRDESSTEEDLIDREGEKLVIITNDAGAGKSTLVNSLCKKIRARYPSSWICRIDLNNYSKVFNEMTKEKTINVPAEFLSKKLFALIEETKLETAFEEQLFKLGINGHIRLFLFFDGFDEICPNYREVVVELLSSLQQTRVEKLFVTTREVEGKFLRKHLDGTNYRIEPLTQDEQTQFLSLYWANKLEKDLSEVKKWIINRTLWCLGRKAGDRTNLANPLTLVMVAECWHDIVFNTNNSEVIDREVIISSIDKLDFRHVHKYFVDRKFEIYAKEKSKITEGNISSNHIFNHFINEIRNVHRHIAMIEIIDENITKQITEHFRIKDELKTELIKIGIVQQAGPRFQFAHRTFGEYLVIEYITENYNSVKPLLDSKEWGEFMKSIGYKRAEQVCNHIIDSRFELYLENNDIADKDFIINKDDFINDMRILHGHLAIVEWFGQEEADALLRGNGLFDIYSKATILKIGLVEEVGKGYQFVVNWIFKNLKQKYINQYIVGPVVPKIVKVKFESYLNEIYGNSLTRKFSKVRSNRRLKNIHRYIAIEQRFGHQAAMELFGKELCIDEPTKEKLLRIGLIVEREWWGRLVFPNYHLTEYFIQDYFQKNYFRIDKVTDVWTKNLLSNYKFRFTQLKLK